MDPVPVEGAGSGFVIDPRGYILTNYHVVAGAQSIEVILGNKHQPLRNSSPDRRNDVALIKIDPERQAVGGAAARRFQICKNVFNVTTDGTVCIKIGNRVFG